MTSGTFSELAAREEVARLWKRGDEMLVRAEAAEARVRTLEEALREGEKILAPFEGSKAIPYQQLLDIARAARREEGK